MHTKQLPWWLTLRLYFEYIFWEVASEIVWKDFNSLHFKNVTWNKKDHDLSFFTLYSFLYFHRIDTGYSKCQAVYSFSILFLYSYLYIGIQFEIYFALISRILSLLCLHKTHIPIFIINSHIHTYIRRAGFWFELKKVLVCLFYVKVFSNAFIYFECNLFRNW